MGGTGGTDGVGEMGQMAALPYGMCPECQLCSLGNTFWEAVLRKTWALHSGSIVE